MRGGRKRHLSTSRPPAPFCLLSVKQKCVRSEKVSHRVCNSVLTASAERIQLLKLLPDQLVNPAEQEGGATHVNSTQRANRSQPRIPARWRHCSCTSPGSRPGQEGWSLGWRGGSKTFTSIILTCGCCLLLFHCPVYGEITSRDLSLQSESR